MTRTRTEKTKQGTHSCVPPRASPESQNSKNVVVYLPALLRRAKTRKTSLCTSAGFSGEPKLEREHAGTREPEPAPQHPSEQPGSQAGTRAGSRAAERAAGQP